jgi:hypothetical protein
VVGVPVGEDEGPDVGQRPTHCRQLVRQVTIEAGHAGVDDRDLPDLLQKVGVGA